MEYLDIKQAAEKLNISPWTLYKWYKVRRIPHRRFGSLIRFTPRSLDAWANRQKRRR
jgi:excisionase family DNA binding protein